VKAGSVPAKMKQRPAVIAYVSPDAVKISFTPPSSNGGFSITSFNVYKDNSADRSLLPLGPHEFTLSGLVEGTSYKIQISSVNSVGESLLSDALIFTFANTPSAPQNLVLTSTASRISMTWKAPASSNGDVVSGYRIHINDGLGSDPTFVHSTEGTPSVLSYVLLTDATDAPLACSNTYLVRITAVNLAGESLPTDGSILVGELPGVPQSLVVTQSVPNTKLTLAWEPPASLGCLPIRSFVLAVDGVDQTALAIKPDQHQVDIDISTGGDYGAFLVLKLKALNDKGAGAYSADLPVVVGSAPNAPTGLTVDSRPSKTSIILSWTADIAIVNNQATTAYRVYRLNADGTESSLFDSSDTSLSTKATLAGLTAGDSLTLVVRAVNSWGESGNSASLVVKIGTKPSTPPAPVLKSSTSSSLTLTIQPSADNGGVPLTGYSVSYSEGQTGTFVSEAITDLSNLEWTHSDFATSSLVDVKVTSTNAIGTSGESNLVTFVVAGVPSAPTTPLLVGVPVEQADKTISATISWTAPADQGSPITGYTLYFKEVGSSSDYTAAYSGVGRPDLLQYTVLKLMKSTQYSFKVTATNRAGEGSQSPALSVTAAGIPTAPRNLRVLSTSTGSVGLSWDPPDSAGGASLTSYKVYYKPSSGSELSTLISGSPPATIASLSLTADIEYTIRVAAINLVGEGLPSANVYTYASSVPAAPAAPFVAGRGSTSLHVGWTSPVSSIPITGYQVYANQGDGSNPTQLVYDGASIPTRLSATISGLVTGREYSFVLKAFNAAGASAASPQLSAIAGKLPDPPLKAPVLVSSTASSISFSWQASTQSYGQPVVRYHIYQDGVDVAQSTTDTYTWTINTGLVTGTAYTFSISAETAIGEGLASYSSTFYAVDTPGSPTLTVESSTRDTCTVSWPAVTPPTGTIIEGYVLLINDGLDGDIFTQAYNGKFNPSKLSANLTNLAARRNYKIKGVAINKAGQGSESLEVTCFTAAAPGQPGRPVYVGSTSTTITVQWEPVFEDGGSPVTEYQLYYEAVEDIAVAGTEDWVLAINSNVLSHQVTSLTPKTLYRFRVRAKSNSIVAGDWSPVSQFYASPMPGQVTIDSSSTEVLGSSVRLRWTKPAVDSANELAILGYSVYTSEGYKTYDFTLLKTLALSDSTELTIDNLTPGVKYGFSVTAFNAAGEGPQSDPLFVYAMAKPGAPDAPSRVASTNTSPTEASITLEWAAVEDTGFVPLTGYKLYQRDTTTSTTTVAFDGSGNPAVLSATVTGLVLDRDYEFWVTALNPLESNPSPSTTLRAAGLPDAPGAISVTARTSNSLELSWASVTQDGGSAVLAYTLVECEGLTL